MRLRLFLWAAAIMLCLGAIDAARDAKTWKWLANLNQPAEEPFRNELPEPQWRTEGHPAGTFVSDTQQTEGFKATSVGDVSPFDRVWDSGWRYVLARLTTDERNLLLEMLSARFDRQMPFERTEAAMALVTRVVGLWKEYQSTALDSLSNLSERNVWTTALQSAESVFRDEALTPLSIISSDGSLGQSTDVIDTRLRSSVERISRGEIRDDTAVFRPAELGIWFYEAGRVAARGFASDGKAEEVSYLQLHKQPAEYRGQVVRVKGTVRFAYRTAAIENYLGIKEYFVYGILPDGGPDSPILVYALKAPQGFPLLADGRDAPAKPGSLREPVEVTGVFFKRCAYAATGGVYTAPLLIADVPRWQPVPPRDLARTPVTASQLAMAAVGALLLAICVTAVVWKRTSQRQVARVGDDAGGFVNLGPLELGPTTAEQLKELEREARREGQP